MVGEERLIGDALLRMHGGELQNATVAGNGSVLGRLRPAAGAMAALRRWMPSGQTMLHLFLFLFLHFHPSGYILTWDLSIRIIRCTEVSIQI